MLYIHDPGQVAEDAQALVLIALSLIALVVLIHKTGGKRKDGGPDDEPPI